MIIDKLKKQTGFTETEMALADFILNYGEELAYLSIHELAELTYTSTTSIRRLCQKTGCEGFRDFKVQFVKEVTAESRGEVSIDVNHPFHFGAKPSLIAANLSNVYTKAIQETMQNMDYRAVDKAVDLIRQADIILLYGIGDSGVTARAFMNRLIKLKKIAILATDGEESVYSLMADQKALGIFVSYRGGLIRMINCARILKKNNVPYISLSSDTSTWLTENATVALKIPSFEVQSDNIATFYSQEAFSFVLNVIYGVLYNRAYEENRSRKKAIDDMTSTDYM